MKTGNRGHEDGGKLERSAGGKSRPAVEQYGKPMAEFIKKHSHWWWWIPEEKKSGLSLNSVVEATLNFASWVDIQALFKLIDIKTAASVFREQIKYSRTNYDKRTLHFFTHYFNRHAS